jgi:hypothetical protein
MAAIEVSLYLPTPVFPSSPVSPESKSPKRLSLEKDITITIRVHGMTRGEAGNMRECDRKLVVTALGRCGGNRSMGLLLCLSRVLKVHVPN